VALLSNDIELRVRAREKLKENNIYRFQILGLEDIETHINNIQLAIREGVVSKPESNKENVIYL